jgi:hypothetical protein
MAFQFPNNPFQGQQVINPTSSQSYTWLFDGPATLSGSWVRTPVVTFGAVSASYAVSAGWTRFADTASFCSGTPDYSLSSSFVNKADTVTSASLYLPPSKVFKARKLSQDIPAQPLPLVNVIKWDAIDTNSLTSLTFSNGLFTNKDTIPRKYNINYSIALKAVKFFANVNTLFETSTWISVSNIPDRISEKAVKLSYPGYETTNNVQSNEATIVLNPGDSFSINWYADQTYKTLTNIGGGWVSGDAGPFMFTQANQSTFIQIIEVL